MGRSTGFIAMHASLSSGQIDVCLIPEVCNCKHYAEGALNLSLLHIYWHKRTIWLKVSFTLDGERGVLAHVEHLLKTKGFCVICVAEGAGQVWCCACVLRLYLCDLKAPITLVALVKWMKFEMWFLDCYCRIYCKNLMRQMHQEMWYLVTSVSTCNKRYMLILNPSCKCILYLLPEMMLSAWNRLVASLLKLVPALPCFAFVRDGAYYTC